MEKRGIRNQPNMAKSDKADDGSHVVTRNRKAAHEYELGVDPLEGGNTAGS